MAFTGWGKEEGGRGGAVRVRGEGQVVGDGGHEKCWTYVYRDALVEVGLPWRARVGDGGR